jgi:hypothetical protein
MFFNVIVGSKMRARKRAEGLKKSENKNAKDRCISGQSTNEGRINNGLWKF